MTLYLKHKLEKRQKFGNVRELQLLPLLVDFSSNDYLGLARSPKLAELVAGEWEKNASHLNGWGATGSRLLTGNSVYAEALERQIAEFHGYEAGLLFNCGYMANVGLLSVIAGPEDIIFFDASVHASTRDGIRLSDAKAFPFRHNDVESLENRLKNCVCRGARFICVESIYSTDGSYAPLKEIDELAKKYNARIIVDEAHAVGVCGPNGRGLVAKYQLTEHVFAQVCTFGKALGTYGAIVLGDQTLKQALVNFATSYIYTTALPLHSLAAIKCSYALFPTMERERTHLYRLVQMFGNSSGTHIHSVSVTGNKEAKQRAQRLREQGFDIRPLLSPTVQKGQEVLRICLHAFNAESEVLSLLQELN